MATITLLDDHTRPKAPKLEGATAQDELPGQHLKMIHRYHLMQMAQVRRTMDEIEAGLPKQAELTQTISDLHMQKTMRMFGNMCGQEC